MGSSYLYITSHAGLLYVYAILFLLLGILCIYPAVLGVSLDFAGSVMSDSDNHRIKSDSMRDILEQDVEV